jgi:uncharacterized protein DUF4383
VTDATPRDTAPVQQLLGFVFGAAYLIVGLAGFTVSDGYQFAARHGGKLLGVFLVNPLQNMVHVVIGGALLAAAFAGARAARAVILAAGAVLLLLGAAGLLVLSHTDNRLALNQPDNALHLAGGLALLGAGLAAARRPAPA